MELEEIQQILKLIPNNCKISFKEIEQIYYELKKEKKD